METWKRSLLWSIKARQRYKNIIDNNSIVRRSLWNGYLDYSNGISYRDFRSGSVHVAPVPNAHPYSICFRSFSLSSKADANEEKLKEILESESDIFPSVLVNRVTQMYRRHGELLEQMMNTDDTRASIPLNNKELATLMPVVSSCQELMECLADFQSLQELYDDAVSTEDEVLQNECQMEMDDLQKRIQEHIVPSLVELSLPSIGDDGTDGSSDAVLEIRAGTGGDEAALFASELLAAYKKCAKSQSFKWDVLSSSGTDLGGIKEASVHITGSGYSVHDSSSKGPYGYFQLESGVHRVQRVPINDVRIHTSAVSVAVLPSLDENSYTTGELLPMSELKVETMRASGAGGQHVNTTDSAVRITHIPTGITAAIQDERSQHKNKAKALKLIAVRVHDVKRQEEIAKRGASRKSLLGSGDRSERIRTYNYPQDRITDHRCKQSEHGISKILLSSSSSSDSHNNQKENDTTLVGIFSSSLKQLQRQQLLQQLQEDQENSVIN